MKNDYFDTKTQRKINRFRKYKQFQIVSKLSARDVKVFS